MKNVFLISTLFASMSILNAQIQMNSSGYVGIGTTPEAPFYLKTSGYTYFSGYLGIGTTPSSSYRLLVGGNSNFIGYSYFNYPVSITFSNTSPALNITANTGYAPGVVISGSVYNYLLYVNGSAYCTGSWVSSDMKLKKNVTKIDGNLMLSKIMNIDGEKYEFKNKEELAEIFKNIKTDSLNNYSKNIPQLSKGYQYGFIAQEIEKEFPELIKTDTLTNLKAVNYDGMIPILLQAIKEQQKMITQLQVKIEGINSTSKQKSNISSSVSDNVVNNNTLSQNNPNPFSESTRIDYFISENAQSSMICIYDMNGTQLKCVQIHQYGQGTILINANELKAGMYFYALIVDGQLIDTKRMVLTN